MFARGDLPSKESVRGLIREIFDQDTVKLPVGEQFKVFHGEQEKAFDIRSTTLKNIYAQLEVTHQLIRATTPIYTKYNFKDCGSYLSKIASDSSPAGIAVRGYAKKTKTMYSIDVEAAVSRNRIDRADIVRKLNDLNESGVLELKLAGVQNVYKITKALPKTATEIEKLVNTIYTLIVRPRRNQVPLSIVSLRVKHCFSTNLCSKVLIS
jgi:hypothetical protein